MLEYASIRLTLVWATPTTVPTIIVAAAIGHSTDPQLARSGSNAERNTRTNAANAAAFTPVDMKPVTEDGAPSYASGVHMWNGTAETLNANPTSSRPSASQCIGDGVSACAAMAWPIRSSRVLPVTPYVNAMPYRKNALAKAPSRKYLNAASVAMADSRRMPVKTYTPIDSTSSARKMTMRSVAVAIRIMPA